MLHITLFHSRRSFSSVSSRFESEQLGLFWASKCLRNMGYLRVVFESSSDRVKSVMNAPHEFPLLRHIAADITALLCSFEALDINVIPREK